MSDEIMNTSNAVNSETPVQQADDGFASFEVSAVDFIGGSNNNASGNASADAASANSNQPKVPKYADIEREQYEAFKKHFEELKNSLAGIEERHKNDVQPEDNETTKELKNVKAELNELKEFIRQNSERQAQMQQQPMQMQQPMQQYAQICHPQIMPGYGGGMGFNVPYYATSTPQPIIPNIAAMKQ